MHVINPIISLIAGCEYINILPMIAASAGPQKNYNLSLNFVGDRNGHCRPY
jgi:hypothetical protein